MAKKWTNKNLAGALHFVTGNCYMRAKVFEDERYCLRFLQAVRELKEARPFKLIAYVLMSDHFHLIINPRDGAVTHLAGALKGLSARRIIDASPPGAFLLEKPAPDGATHQVWQDSFKALPLWSDWLIWQKINYIHNNPLKAHLVKSAADYRWSSFRAFYHQSSEPLPVDREWWWPEDVKKLSVAWLTGVRRFLRRPEPLEEGGKLSASGDKSLFPTCDSSWVGRLVQIEPGQNVQTPVTCLKTSVNESGRPSHSGVGSFIGTGYSYSVFRNAMSALRSASDRSRPN